MTSLSLHRIREALDAIAVWEPESQKEGWRAIAVRWSDHGVSVIQYNSDEYSDDGILAEDELIDALKMVKSARETSKASQASRLN